MAASISPSPLHLILPSCSALVYVIAALFLKRAAELGADVWRSTRVCNFTAALVFSPLLFFDGTIPSAAALWQPSAVALVFVAGQVLTVLSLRIGDVSVATPVMGLKVILVAFLTTLLVQEPLSARLWIAAGLSSAAIALLNIRPDHPHDRTGLTILLAAGAALCYACFDVLVQKWSPAWGLGRLLPVTMGIAAVYTLLLPRAGGVMSLHGGRWMLAGAICLAVQALMLVSSIALYSQATTANVMYSARGMWSIVLVWLAGHWFRNNELGHGKRILAWRLTGAACLLAAILIVLAAPR